MFERKTFEEITEKMTNWSKGVSNKLTDFRVGSKIRTIYESVAIVMEEFYDNSFRSARRLIQDNLYSIFGFEKLPPTYASGVVTFSLGKDSFGNNILATNVVLISANSIVQTQATETQAPIRFFTSEDKIIEVGQNSVDISVFCEFSGTIGNVGANTITSIVLAPSEIATVANGIDFVNGVEEETSQQQKYRFQKFISGRVRGTRESIEYGATTASIVNSSGITTEQVRDAKAIEDLSSELTRGVVKLYIWNGVGSATIDLLVKVSQIVDGYYDSNGVAVYGYKPAGVQVLVLNPTLINITLKITILEYDNSILSSLNEAKSKIESVSATFFSNRKIGESVLYSDLFYEMKKIQGIKDIDFVWKKPASSFSDNNLSVGDAEVLSLSSLTYDLT